MIHDYIGDWRWTALRGLTAVLFGVATLAWPSVTLWALVVLFGAFVLVDGIAILSAAITGEVHDRGWWGFCGVASIAAGIVTFVWPSITALALLFVIAAWAFVTGLVQLVTAVRMRKEIRDEWALGIIGVLSMALGVFLAITPGSGALVITWAIGWYAVLFGMMQFMLAFEIHHQAHGSHHGAGTSARHVLT